MNIAICDDNISICSNIESVILKYGFSKCLNFNIDVFYSAEDFLNTLNTQSYDVIFLDIEIGNFKGFEIGEYLRNDLKNEFTKIVYISAYKEYVMELFRTRPFNFIVKPINDNHLIKTLEKIIELLDKHEDIFMYKKDKNIYRLDLKEILYFESIGKKIRIVTQDRDVIYYDKLNNIYEKIKKYNFFFSHRSYLVNYNSVISFRADCLIICNNDIIPISRSKKKEVRKLEIKMESK